MPSGTSLRDGVGLAGVLVCLSLFAIIAPARSSLPLHFLQGEEPEQPVGGLVGASISDVVWSGRYLWVATNEGLARHDPRTGDGLSAEHWVTFTEQNGLGRGAVSALAAAGDTVWVATLVDSVIGGQRDRQAGNGLSLSLDGGLSWEHIPNGRIFDPAVPSFRGGPRTAAQNACFGLAFEGDTVWGTFFAGSSVRSKNNGRSWERVLPDGADRIVFTEADTAADSLDILADSLSTTGADDDRIAQVLASADSLRRQRLLHRTFSVIAYGDTAWIGTSAGVARTLDGGATWANFRVRLDSDDKPLPGNISAEWVVALERQRLSSGASVIWAGTRVAEGQGQADGISYTLDSGNSWRFFKESPGEEGPGFAWDFAFTDDGVWASTEKGLFLSEDGGLSWGPVTVADPDTRDALRGTFNGLESIRGADGVEAIWVGAENGLGRSVDGGVSWKVLNFPLLTRSVDTGRIVGEVGVVDPESSTTYAAPNPFDPSEGELTRIIYSLAGEAAVTIDLFDFASRRVRRLVGDAHRTGGRNHGENWDGRDDDGDVVANGVYFYRLETDGGHRAFGKVVVLD